MCETSQQCLNGNKVRVTILRFLTSSSCLIWSIIVGLDLISKAGNYSHLVGMVAAIVYTNE